MSLRSAVLAVLALAVAASPAAAAPLRDGRTTNAGPRSGYLYTCAHRRAHARRPPWVGRGQWFPNRKPTVDGRIPWPGASFRLSGRRLHGNALPVGQPTGIFPPRAGDDARPYVPRGRRITELALSGTLPRPRRAHRRRCVALDQPVGIAKDGVWIMPAADRAGHDLVVWEVHDRCGGTVAAGGRYFYRARSRCLPSGLVGWARDGHPIYGPRGRGGKLIHNRDLDACHGRFERQGRRRVYRYRLTGEFPYSIGCFRGRPARDWRVRTPGGVPARPATVTTTPTLYPGFSRSVTDYVVRCSSTPVVVDVDAGTGTVAVDGGPARNGRFKLAVPLAGGQGFSFTTKDVYGTRTSHVRCLPSDFPGYSFSRTGTPGAEWYVTAPALQFAPSAPDYLAIFDGNGVPVWFYKGDPSPIDAKLLPDGNIAFTHFLGKGFVTSSSAAYEIRRLDGSLVKTVKTVGSPTDHHDLILEPNGNYLVLTYPPRDHVNLSPYGGPSDATVVDGEVQELSPNGTLLWSWNSKDHLALDETGRWWPTVLSTPVTLDDGRTAYDHVHVNSVEPTSDNGLILSFRHTDALYEIDRSTGAIRWKFGGTHTSQSLDVVGDPTYTDHVLGGQHDGRQLADGTITVHDNESNWSGALPRLLRFRISGNTATILEYLTGPEASSCCGSARRLSGGGWVASWGGIPLVAEYDVNQHPVFQLRFDSRVFSYRAQPVARGVLSGDALRRGMDAIYPR